MRLITFARVLPMSLLLAVLGACAAGSAHDEARVDAVADGSTFSMQPGAQVAFADHGRLHYLRLVADSRCQPDVQCIWAGDAEVAFEWIPAGGAAQAFSLHTGKASKAQVLGGRRLVLVSVARGPTPSVQMRVEPATSP